MKKRNIWKITTILTAVLTVILAVAIPITSIYETVINVALNVKTQQIIPDPDAKIYFWTNYESGEALLAHDEEICYQLEAEGAALLVNKDGTLPLPTETKFSLFSQSTTDPIKVGTGAYNVTLDDGVSLYSALENAFSKGCVNTDLWKFNMTAGYRRENAKLSGGSPDQYRINEIPWEKYTDALKSTFADYGDVALVVLSRSGGEGADLPSGLPELEEYMTDGDYLRLCKEEVELLENLQQLKAQGVFKKIVVLLNFSNPLQLDFIETYDIDAALWVGNVGQNGIPAVADILAGKINPSGRIVDTFLKDNHSAPVMQNYDAFPYTNAADYDTGEAQNNTDFGIDKCNRNYVVYAEGIYVGYRYFETRYEDFVLNQGNAGDYCYDDDVAFPFGFGLSYTDFEYSNFSVEDKGETFEVNVDVKNIGSVDGKHTVQIYFQSPYTQYDIDNQVEKAAVEICGFDKKMIGAGKTEHFTITVNKEDLTSYDHMNAKTYILDAGDYYFTVGKNAHDAINNILAAKGADTSRMSGTGDAGLTAKWTLMQMDTTTYAVSSVTGMAITNLFDDADLNKYAGAEGQSVTYLTRSDWVGTFPTTVSLRITEQMWADGLTTEESGRAALVEKYKALYYPDATLPETGVSGSLNAIDFVEVAYDDPSWDALIAQIPFSTMTDLICNGAYQTIPIPDINLPGTQETDGPCGFTKSIFGGGHGTVFTSGNVTAATFNLELIEEVGRCIGEDLLHAVLTNEDAALAGLYGPGANIHRSAYLGRHGEYFSEDGWLTGIAAAAEIKGLRDRGVSPSVKHYALNDQEEGRYGISTWCNEQAIREIYLEGFEGAILGGGESLMSSFNRIGVVWSGAHHGLMTGILRDEWGLTGSVISDMSINAKWMDYRLGVLAGQDRWCGQKGTMGTLDNLENDPAIVSAVAQATKNIVYNVTRTSTMNVGNATVTTVTPWWQTTLYIATGVSVLLLAASVVMLLKNKKKTGTQ